MQGHAADLRAGRLSHTDWPPRAPFGLDVQSADPGAQPRSSLIFDAKCPLRGGRASSTSSEPGVRNRLEYCRASTVRLIYAVAART